MEDARSRQQTRRHSSETRQHERWRKRNRHWAHWKFSIPNLCRCTYTTHTLSPRIDFGTMKHDMLCERRVCGVFGISCASHCEQKSFGVSETNTGCGMTDDFFYFRCLVLLARLKYHMQRGVDASYYVFVVCFVPVWWVGAIVAYVQCNGRRQHTFWFVLEPNRMVMTSDDELWSL